MTVAQVKSASAEAKVIAWLLPLEASIDVMSIEIVATTIVYTRGRFTSSSTNAYSISLQRATPKKRKCHEGG